MVSKFSTLMSRYFALPTQEIKEDEAFKTVESMMQVRMITSDRIVEKISNTCNFRKMYFLNFIIFFLALLQGLYVETTHQLTREDIKKQSSEIVEANSRNEDLIPLIVVPFRKWKQINQKK